MPVTEWSVTAVDCNGRVTQKPYIFYVYVVNAFCEYGECDFFTRGAFKQRLIIRICHSTDDADRLALAAHSERRTGVSEL